MQARTFAILVSIIILATVINLIRRQKMTFKYSVIWIALSAGALFLAIFDGLLASIAGFMGFALPSNFVFFCLLSFFMLQSLFLTMYVNEQNSKLEALAQTVGILEYQQKLKSDSAQTK